jgi:cytochrome c oxidase subunit IV
MTATEHPELTDTEHAEHDVPHDGHQHKPDSFYIKVAVALAVITGVEVGLYYIDLGAWYLPVLLFLMIVKFTTVVSLFMHLRFDNKIFSWLFYTGLFLAVFVYIAALLTFRFFDGS